MKRTKVVLCLVACLIVVSGCDSTIGKLSTAIRYGWERLNGKIPAPDPEPSDFTEIENVPGPPPSDREREIIAKVEAVRKIAVEPTGTTNEDKREAEIKAAKTSLDRTYPPVKPPVSRSDMLKAVKELFPARLGGYVSGEQAVGGQGNDSEEELVPGFTFPTNPSYLGGSKYYTKTGDKKILLVLLDRGNLPEWVRTASWYYTRKGTVGKNEQPRMRFVKTIERNGKTWVIWESRENKLKCAMLWHGRWEIYINMIDNLDDVDALFSSAWIEKNM